MYREQEFHFVYEDGVLRPEERLDLPEGSRGIASIREAVPPVNSSARKRALEAIHRIGESGVFNSGGKKLTRDQMHERG
jgi:predicted DNA-binding antitoxin AbrB/MazE fold protein